MTKKKAQEILLYSLKFENFVYPLNKEIQKAYTLGYKPLVEVKTCSLTGNVPIIVVTFFHQNDNNNSNVHKGQKCCR